MRQVKPAENYDVISFARTMNEDFGGKVKELFNPETMAVDEALKSGLHIFKMYDLLLQPGNTKIILTVVIRSVRGLEMSRVQVGLHSCV